MFISTFKTSRVYLPVLLIAVAFVLWLDGFWFYNETIVANDNRAPFYNIIAGFFESYKLLNVLLAFIFLIVQAFMLNNVITSKNLVDRHSYMPGFIYAVLMSSSFDMFSFHPVLIANFFLILILDKIIDIFDENKVYFEIFNVGLLTGVASLFYFPAVFFILLAMIALFLYYLVSLRAILATFIGFFTPFFFLGLYYFMIDKLHIYFAMFADIFSPCFILNLESGLFFRAYMIVFAFIALTALFKVYFVVIRERPMRIRKRYNIILYFLLISIISLFFITDIHIIHHGLVSIPIAVVMSCFFHSNKKKLWNELLFTLLIVFLFLVKFDRYDLLSNDS